MTSELLEGYLCEFLRVPASTYREFFGYARWFYKGDSFEALQCVWPDRHGRFPWDGDVTEGVRARQPLLGPRDA